MRTVMGTVTVAWAVASFLMGAGVSWGWLDYGPDTSPAAAGARNDLAMRADGVNFLAYAEPSGANSLIRIRHTGSTLYPLVSCGGSTIVATVTGSTDVGSMDLHVALDDGDNPHVLFFDPTNNGALKHAWCKTDAPAGWQVDTVASGTGADDVPGEYNDIAMQGNELHVVFTQRTEGVEYYRKLMYRKITGGNAPAAWSSQSAPATWDGAAETAHAEDGIDLGLYCSLGLTSGGVAHTAYYVGSNNILYYAHRGGGSWAQEDPVSGMQTPPNLSLWGKHARVAVDGSGQPYISFFEEADGKVYYTARTTGNATYPWTDATDVTTPGRTAEGASDIHLFAGGGGTINVGIAFVEQEGGVHHMTYWHTLGGVPAPAKTAVSNANAMDWVSLTTGPYNKLGDQYTTAGTNRAHICYHRGGGTGAGLRYVYDNGGVTAVDIQDFRAVAQGRRDVALSWHTGNELGSGVQGFNLYRWRDPDHVQPVNEALIPAQGDEAGMLYTYVDKKVPKRLRWSYLLEALYFNGEPPSTLGPVRVEGKKKR